jgi:hypothetical protein
MICALRRSPCYGSLSRDLWRSVSLFVVALRGLFEVTRANRHLQAKYQNRALVLNVFDQRQRGRVSTGG